MLNNKKWLASFIVVVALTAPSSIRAKPMCESRAMENATKEINHFLSVLVENAPVSCLILKDEEPKKCSVLCATTYAMTESQRRATLVYLAGAAGLQINKLGTKNFGKVIYVDRDLARANYGLTMPAIKIADIQRRAKADQLSAEGIIAETMSGFKKMPVKRPK